MRRAGRVDNTQAAIVAALVKIGCRVHSTAGAGGGFPDLVVSFRGGRVILLMECKSKGGTLTPAQKRFHEMWPVHVVTSPEQACAVVIAAGNLEACHGVDVVEIERGRGR